MIMVLTVLILCLFIGFFLLIRWGIRSAKENEELVNDIEVEREARKFQRKYAEISNRPASSADDILKWMRGTNDNSIK